MSHKVGSLMKLLESFSEYAAYHFLSEEALMREHIEAGEDSVKHIVAYRSDWSINHILETDQQLGRELNRHEVR